MRTVTIKCLILKEFEINADRTAKEISKVVGTTASNVRIVASEADVKLKKKGGKKQLVLEELKADTDRTAREIAEIVGVTKSYVSQLAISEGYELMYSRGHRENEDTLRDEEAPFWW